MVLAELIKFLSLDSLKKRLYYVGHIIHFVTDAFFTIGIYSL